MIRISVKDHGAKDLLARLGGAISEEKIGVAAHAAIVALKKYHTDFNGAGKWASSGGPTHGTGRNSSGWGQTVAMAWAVARTERGKATLTNSHPHFLQKVEGGTISAKKSSALTLPMIPQAHGKTVRAYQEEFHAKLFRIGNGLFERAEAGDHGAFTLAKTLTGRHRRKKQTNPVARSAIRCVYALKKSIDQKPWPGAMPEESVFISPFIAKLKEEIAKNYE